MQIDFFDKLEAVLSAPRLSAYRHDGVGDVDVLSRYLLNAALSQALYPPLQNLEVCLRNTIDSAAVTLYGTNWLLDTTTFLDSRERMQVATASNSLAKARHPLNHGNLIAELNFGFWTSLLDRRYERSLWQRCIATAFPDMPKPVRTRKQLSARFNRIRKLRNRIFHHERIVHWKDLPQQHQDIVEAIGWISPELRDLTEKLDTFQAVYTAGINPWRQSVLTHWPAAGA